MQNTPESRTPEEIAELKRQMAAADVAWQAKQERLRLAEEKRLAAEKIKKEAAQRHKKEKEAKAASLEERRTLADTFARRVKERQEELGLSNNPGKKTNNGTMEEVRRIMRSYRREDFCRN